MTTPLDEALAEARKTLALCDVLDAPASSETRAKWLRIQAGLVAAIDRVKLPVIATCGQCRSPRMSAGGLYCSEMPFEETFDPRIERDAPPPAWCPLRGAP